MKNPSEVRRNTVDDLIVVSSIAPAMFWVLRVALTLLVWVD